MRSAPKMRAEASGIGDGDNAKNDGEFPTICLEYLRNLRRSRPLSMGVELSRISDTGALMSFIAQIGPRLEKNGTTRAENKEMAYYFLCRLAQDLADYLPIIELPDSSIPCKDPATIFQLFVDSVRDSTNADRVNSLILLDKIILDYQIAAGEPNHELSRIHDNITQLKESDLKENVNTPATSSSKYRNSSYQENDARRSLRSRTVLAPKSNVRKRGRPKSHKTRNVSLLSQHGAESDIKQNLINELPAQPGRSDSSAVALVSVKAPPAQLAIEGPCTSFANPNGREVWMHKTRLPEHMIDEACFVCESGDVTQPLVRCDYNYNHSSLRCRTLFHDECIKKYNAGDFSVEYMKTLTGKTQCPLHHCDVCWTDRRKTTSAMSIDSIVECTGCYRGFHYICRPGGLTVETLIIHDKDKGFAVTKFEARGIRCHNHVPDDYKKYLPDLSKKATHLQACCECQEKDSRPLIHCETCVRSFHPECFSIGKVNNRRVNKTMCEACIHSESIRDGQFIICRYYSSFYAAKVTDPKQFPTDKRVASQDKLHRKIGQPGFITVLWAGAVNIFNVVPAFCCFPMYSGSYKQFGVRVTDQDYRLGWKELEETLENEQVPYPSLQKVENNYTAIKYSVYHPTCEVPKLDFVDEEDVMCSCPVGAKDRCGPKSGCTTRHIRMECPPSCEAKGGCENRLVSKKSVHPLLEKRPTNGKGFGVFATGTIPAGTRIAEYAGEIISNQEKQHRIELSAKSKNDEENHYMMSLDSSRIIDCKYKGNIARYLNHSCDPNCCVEVVEVVVGKSTCGNGKVVKLKYDKRNVIRTLRTVNKDEELCFDYDMEEYSVGRPLPECRCNAPNCSGRLGKKSRGNKKVAIPLAATASDENQNNGNGTSLHEINTTGEAAENPQTQRRSGRPRKPNKRLLVESDQVAGAPGGTRLKLEVKEE